jgi:hypothetical protein
MRYFNTFGMVGDKGMHHSGKSRHFINSVCGLGTWEHSTSITFIRDWNFDPTPFGRNGWEIAKIFFYTLREQVWKIANPTGFIRYRGSFCKRWSSCRIANDKSPITNNSTDFAPRCCDDGIVNRNGLLCTEKHQGNYEPWTVPDC